MNLFDNICLDRLIIVLNVCISHKKGKVCNVVLEGITNVTQATLESMCHVGMCYWNVDDMWDLFESLSSYQRQCDSASESLVILRPTSLWFSH